MMKEESSDCLGMIEAQPIKQDSGQNYAHYSQSKSEILDLEDLMGNHNYDDKYLKKNQSLKYHDQILIVFLTAHSSSLWLSYFLINYFNRQIEFRPWLGHVTMSSIIFVIISLFWIEILKRKFKPTLFDQARTSHLYQLIFQIILGLWFGPFSIVMNYRHLFPNLFLYTLLVWSGCCLLTFIFWLRVKVKFRI